ncbi:biopolymer transporter ExbD [Adhaeribacter arboris]|uniref:Biopolymer transporter ExbD n=1 Tax=Adhaeribacter arboris TaxID=2072846 RepID=A0A2T2YBW2_9BACT|nr:biopolymer transporter ExbD [Adhaeribacter arboris]PSR52999.1 biopolymer transporter ExbD [Adhaeribacter arboris]
MQLRGRRRVTSHVETGSMNDIMFFLMLFFLIVSTMVNPNVIKLLLPSANSGKSVTKQQINLSVNEKGEYYINRSLISPDNLEQELGAVVAGIDEPTVVLRVDVSLNVQTLVNILEVGNKLKIKMIMATQTPKG